jgi:glycosyltransferase involved in cell wall biosynthesis
MGDGAEGVLLVGPCPPPHGGVSVHVAGVRRELVDAGVPCALLNARPGAPASDEYLRAGTALGLVRAVARHGRRGWLVHTHINGHNPKSWLLALAAGIGGMTAPARMLTVHSGMASGHLASGRVAPLLARLACRLHDRVICVNDEIRRAIAAAGVPAERLRVLAAAAPSRRAPVELPVSLARWVRERTPLLSATLAFEPEYRFDLLAGAVAVLRHDHPAIGCVVMGSGSGDEQARALIAGSGLESAVRLTGDVDHDTCLQLIAESNLFVRPNDRDGDALSVREALALGVPVVASDVGSRPPEAILFAAGDFQGMRGAIRRALAQPGGRPSAAEPAAMNELLSLYRELAGLRDLRPAGAVPRSAWSGRSSA